MGSPGEDAVVPNDPGPPFAGPSSLAGLHPPAAAPEALPEANDTPQPADGVIDPLGGVLVDGQGGDASAGDIDDSVLDPDHSAELGSGLRRRLTSSLCSRSPSLPPWRPSTTQVCSSLSTCLCRCFGCTSSKGGPLDLCAHGESVTAQKKP